MDTNKIVRDFIEENLTIFEDVEFSDDDNIFERGFVNSLFAMRLISFIEENFSVNLDSEDMNISNFNTVNNIANFIGRKKMQA